MRFQSSCLRLAALWLTVLVAASARAESPPLYLSAPGELGFAVRDETLVAARCRAQRCDFAVGVPLPIPAELLPRIDSSVFTRLELDRARVAVRVRVPVEDRAWEALVTLPPTPGTPPGVPFAEFTGTTVDDEGERVGKWVEVYPKEGGRSEVVVGSLRDDVTLCGRRTLLDPRVLYAPDLELHRVKLMRLSQAERDAAPRLVAVADEPSTGTAISRAVVASSGKRSPAALSDGNGKSDWAEDRGGDGSGEFVVFRTPEVLPVSHVYFAYPKEPASVPVAFWVATDASVYRVEVPAEAVLPGAELSVALPSPETTSCLALVLDRSSSSAPDQDVSLAEFGARAAVDEAAIEQFVARLSDPNEDADALVRTLVALGKGAVRVLSRRYDALSPVGRARAFQVFDALPCEDTARAVARAIGRSETDRQATERLLQCGELAESAALKELQKARGERAALLAEVVAKLDPKRAAAEFVPLLARSDRGRRRALRAVLSRIASEPEVRPVLLEWLADDELDPVAAIDLLRAIGTELPAYQPAAAARIAAVLAGQPGFRERYLLVEPAARLASTDPALASYLGQALTRDEEAAVRARAARVLPPKGDLLPALLAAADDGHVRVREAAILNLAEHGVEQASAVLLRRAATDPWPFVRAASVRGLAGLAPSPVIDRALAERAEHDDSPEVRRPALFALGSRNARGAVEVVRDRLDDDDEDPYVRAAAAATLGTLCDAASVDDLMSHAKHIARLTGDEARQVVGRAAVHALGRIAPPDLEERFEVFEGPHVPPWAKQAAAAALDHPEPCAR